MRIAYDLDGVLAVGPPPNSKKWGLMKGPERRARLAQLEEHYHRAPVLLEPPGKFWVVSARKEGARLVTETWLSEHFGSRCCGLYLLSQARTTERVICFKADALCAIRAEAFTEDNLTVLRGVARLYRTCRYYYFDGKESRPL